MNTTDLFIKAYTSIFFVMGPFSIIPFFVSLTEKSDKREKDQVINKATVTSFFICLFFALTGNFVFRLFGITIDSFRVAGGLLLLLMAISMLQAHQSKIRVNEEEQLDSMEKEDISVFPLSIPLIAGPGTITTVVLFTGEAVIPIHYAILLLALLLSSLSMFIILKFSHKVYEVIGKSGINILTRLIGLILATMGVEFILKGVQSYLKL